MRAGDFCRLVLNTNFPFIRLIKAMQDIHERRFFVPEFYYKTGGCTLLSKAPCSQWIFYFTEGRSILMEPSLIPSLAFWIWAFRSAGILLSQSWKGARPTPPFCRVPVLMPALTEPSATVFRYL